MNKALRKLYCIVSAIAILVGSTFLAVSPASAALDNLIGGAVSTAAGIFESQQDFTLDQERQIGRTAAARVLGTRKLDLQTGSLQYLTLLTQGTAKIASLPPTLTGYHAAVVEDQSINAYAFPGGTILITRGMFEVVDGNELIAVLAHELAHLKLKHGVNAIKTAKLTSSLTTAAASTVASSELTAFVASSAAALTDTLVTKGYSRANELEADAEAVQILRKIGIPKSAFVSALQKVERAQQTTKISGGLLSTHPSISDRVAALTSEVE